MANLETPSVQTIVVVPTSSNSVFRLNLQAVKWQRVDSSKHSLVN